MKVDQPTVLLVDDEKSNLKVLSELLKADVNICLAISGQQAIDKCISLNPDLILLDVIMPIMDGFETIKKLKAIKSIADIPVIFITGLNSADKEELGLTLGAVDYIVKPFNSAVVKARVATQLEIVRQRKELQTLSTELTHASKIKSRFLANMSHEIRTPLTAVIGYAESILAGEIAEQEKSNAISIIYNSGQHLLSLVNDILDISKIEADKLDVEFLPIQLFQLIEEIRVLVVEKASQKNVKFSIEYQLPLPTQLITDPTRLKQILINLVNNAVKFTEEGYVKLVVRHKEGLLVFAIKDSGIGICDSDLNKLFVAFSQVGRSITGNRGGTGLGLNISKYLSEKLGGNIKVVSEKGVGSCFTVSIALNEVKNSVWVKNEDDITNTIKSSCDPFKHKTQFNGKVLLAEDDEVLRKLFSIILENFGLAVTSVEDGKKLVEIALIEDFDLIFSDIHMPNMGGIEAMTLIKAAGCNSPFIALTANAMKHEVEHYMKAGFNGHLSKPIQRERFAHIINKYLNINSNNKQFEMPRNEIIALKNEFLDELPQYINKIKKALSEQNWQELQFHAHRLNGSSAVFKLNKITKLAAKLESALEKEEFPKNKHKMNNLLDDLFNCAEEASQKCKTVRNESLM